MSRTSKKVKVHLIAGARPNFMKVAPLFHELAMTTWCDPILIHTGQHFDDGMAGVFLRDLGLPAPHFELAAGRGSHAQQTASVMIAYERVCLENRPEWVVVVGDVNSTLACALVAKKLDLPVAHLEAGLRSGDRTMPEEINRICTDAISDLLWTPSPDADHNLSREGVQESRIVRIGNVMIDSLEAMRPAIERQDSRSALGLSGQPYGVVTLHRPSNVDEEGTLRKVVRALVSASRAIPLVFPIHPRTRQRLRDFGLEEALEGATGFSCIDPLGYLEFMSLVWYADVLITDSGGIQEETTYLGIPCLTLRETTERPITVTQGTNRLVRPEGLADAVAQIAAGDIPKGRIPEFWDGKAAKRAAQSLRRAIEDLGRD